MIGTRVDGTAVICPNCRGRGMIRPPGEWANETCPTCDGSGEVASDDAADAKPAGTEQRTR